jgi:cytochrome c-type biogenesis protein CcmH/NrfF
MTAAAFATASFDDPFLVGFDWALWHVPEPSSILMLVAGGMIALRVRRRQRLAS